MTPLQRSVKNLTVTTERQLTALYEREHRGILTRAQFLTTASALLYRARVQGVTIADLGLSTALTRMLGRTVSPLGLTMPASEQDRLRGSIETVLGKEVAAESAEQLAASLASRLARLGRDVPADAAAWAMRKAMQERRVTGWTRVTSSDPCPVCSSLADGSVMSPATPMIRHTGCGCIQAPVSA